PKNDELFNAVTEAQGDFSSTNAGYLSSVATINWPRNGVEQLIEGKWRFELGNVSNEDKYHAGTLTTVALFKEDKDLSSGRLRVNVVFAGDARQNAGLHQAFDEALLHWVSLYDTVGVTLDVTQSEWDTADLSAPVFGIEPDYISIANASDPFTVSVVIVPELADFEDVFGVAGDIPGPLSATTRSAVIIAGDLSAGSDGVFNPEETRIFGETMAHEVGHYMGLYHPVETEWDHWDSLDDTDECTGQNRCITAMSDHLMFPFPVCGLAACQAQVVLTGDQMGVMQAYVGVD
ncbi:MAG: hypothetical protein GWP91_20760, partial [Rhodobacterales bacterium]|nr:hypothetical protein [Rhodobacterales bacterium]